MVVYNGINTMFLFRGLVVFLGSNSAFSPPLLLVQHILDILDTLALLADATLGGKARGDGHLLGALGPELVEPPPLLDVGDAPLLEVLYPGGGAVPLKVVALGGAGPPGGRGVPGGVDDAVGVEAGKVGVAGGPAGLALLAVGDGGAGADGVAAGVAREGPEAHCVCVCVRVCWG